MQISSNIQNGITRETLLYYYIGYMMIIAGASKFNFKFKDDSCSLFETGNKLYSSPMHYTTPSKLVIIIHILNQMSNHLYGQNVEFIWENMENKAILMLCSTLVQYTLYMGV